MYWSYWWLYEPSESTGSEPVIYRTRSFSFFTVYHHVVILGLNELLFSFPPVLELQQHECKSRLTQYVLPARVAVDWDRVICLPPWHGNERLNCLTLMMPNVTCSSELCIASQ